MTSRTQALSAIILFCAAPAAAQTIGPVDKVIVGSTETQGIDTNLDGHPVPADIGQIYVGNTNPSADAITIDSGSNFPPGIAFRRYLNDPAAPTVVTPGTQLGYLDFRGYSGNQFWNAGSLDMVVDGITPFVDGALPTSKMRFAVSDGNQVFVPMELRANGSLELGAIVGDDYYGPEPLEDAPKLFVNTTDNRWSAVFAARPSEGAGYALRVHTLGETADDYLFGASSGEGAGTFKFSVRGNGDVHVAGDLFLGDTNVGATLTQLGTTLDQVESNVAAITGQFGTASGPGAVAIGTASEATSPNSTAIGQAAVATGSNALSVGNYARANGDSAVAHGDNAVASGAGAIAFGSISVSTGASSVALGQNARALRDNALAVGPSALAQAASATAVGATAVATGDNATAVGANARATQAGATAVGSGAATTAPNEVALGGSGSSVRVGDIDASTAAQVGPVDVVTVDQNGTLGRQSVATSAQFDTVRTSMVGALAMADTQFDALQGRVEGLEGQVGKLFDLATTQRKEMRQGIAAVTALAQPHFPSEAGRTSYASNVGYYRGEVGFSAGFMHRFEGDFGISAGVSHAGGKNTALRVGVAGEF